MQWKEGDSVIVLENDAAFHGPILQNADIVIYSRVCPFNIEKILDLRDKYGFKLVVDIDDYWFLYDQHHLINIWLADKTSSKMIRSIEIADYIFCTNEKLRSRIHIINENVSIIKNAFPFGEQQFTKAEPYVGGLIKFLYAGSITHLHDIRILEPAFNACRNNPKIFARSMLSVAGYSPTRTWERILNVVKQYGNHGYILNRPLREYMDSYNTGHVCIAPLMNNEFNTYKSTLKLVEAGCKGRPIICSDMLPYKEDEDCPGVILCKNSKDWYQAFEMFVDQPEKINELGSYLHSYVVENYNLATENKKRYELFKQIIAL